jgi:HD superfamily phosphohydrolase
MPSKIFRDPLYNYITLDLKRDTWLLELLDTSEFQRLRRIHQLGISYLTYPGADHNRLAHSLGVLHLMFEALQHIEHGGHDTEVEHARASLLTAALIHDVGHGPFSHVFEPCLGIDHEEWSRRIVLEQTGVNEVLRSKVGQDLPQKVADLIDPKNHTHAPWQKYLLSSQLDVDRLDYLRRDSLFTGASYGHFDWYRLLNTFEFHDTNGQRSIYWPYKSILAIEEYIFARYYMYQNVYLHKTTRGFEMMLQAMWKSARELHDDGTDVGLIAPIRQFWETKKPTIEQYLALEEYTVLFQIQQWASCSERSLADLAQRFLKRKRFAMIEPPAMTGQLDTTLPKKWKAALRKLVKSKGYDPPELYCLEDSIKAKYNSPYLPEKEGDEQTVKNAIRVMAPGETQPIEIVKLRPRLKPITGEATSRVRFYVPKEIQGAAIELSNKVK